MSGIRQLTLVTPGDEAMPAHQVRWEMAKVLRSMADVVEAGTTYTVNDVEHACPAALLVIPIDAEGEPVPMATGVGPVWSDLTDWVRFVADLGYTLHDMRRAHVPGQVVFAGTEQVEDQRTPYQRMHDMWVRREEGRIATEAAQAAKKAQHEAEYPILCDCGQRLRTLGGMAQHHRGRRHRWWASRQTESAPS